MMKPFIQSIKRNLTISHIVKINCLVRDPVAVAAACYRLGLAEPRHDRYRLFNSDAIGLGVQLRGWRFPVVFNIADGSVFFDNFNGAWGHESALNSFLQRYAVEKATIEARKQGHSVREQLLADGSIKVTIQVGEAT